MVCSAIRWSIVFLSALLLAVSLAYPGILNSTDFSFERLGPYGGTVRSLLVCARDSRIVYLGTNDGQLFKSTDGGLSWNLLYPGLNRRQLAVDTLVEDPEIPDHVYAGGWDVRSNGGGLYESRDAGLSWNRVELPDPDVAVRGFAISRRRPSYMIAGTSAGVFLTDDGGKTWHLSGTRIEGFRQIESVAIDPDEPNDLFVGTWHLGYRSIDFGKTWTMNDSGMITDSDVFSISIDERNPKTVYASACTGLYRSTNRGASWTRLKVFPKSFLVRAQVVAIDPTDAAHIYGGTTEGLFLSANSGQTWSRITPSDLTVNAVQVDPADSSVILIGTDLHGILRSTDGGRSWAVANKGFVNRSIARIVVDPDKTGRFLVGEFFEGRTGGFYVYDNPLNDWTPPSATDVPGEGMLSFLMIPASRGRIAGTAKGAYYMPPGSDGWERLPGPISTLSVYDLALDKDGEWIYAGTNDGVYRTQIEELNFQKPSGYSFIPRVFSLLASRIAPGRVFAGTHLGVLRSDDSGETWKFASEGIPDHTIIECLVFAPGGEAHLFAGTNSGLYESKNGAETWIRVPDGRLGVDIPSVTFLDSSGMRIMAADNTFGGVFLSEDGGGHWSKIARPDFGSPVRSIVQDPSHSSVFYLGTGSEGVYRLSLADSGRGEDR